MTATAEDVAGTARAPDATAGGDGEGGGQADGKPPIPLAVTPAQAAKAKRTAAISGLVTASLTLAIVAATFTFQSVYQRLLHLPAGRPHPVLARRLHSTCSRAARGVFGTRS